MTRRFTTLILMVLMVLVAMPLSAIATTPIAAAQDDSNEGDETPIGPAESPEEPDGDFPSSQELADEEASARRATRMVAFAITFALVLAGVFAFSRARREGDSDPPDRA